MVNYFSEIGFSRNTAQKFSINKETWRCVDPDLRTCLNVLLHHGLVPSGLQARRKRNMVQAQICRGVDQISLIESRLVGEHRVVHFPVFALRESTARGFRCHLRMLMDRREGEVKIGKFY